jgi:hypothetical protein
MGVDLHDQQPPRVAARPQEFVPGRAHVEGQVHVARLVGWRGLGHHHPWREPGQDRRELPEAAGHELDAEASVVQQPLGRAEEATTVRDARLGEDLVVVEAERAAHLEVLPVLPDAERREEGVRVGRTQPEPQRVHGPHQRDGLVDGQHPGHTPPSPVA